MHTAQRLGAFQSILTLRLDNPKDNLLYVAVLCQGRATALAALWAAPPRVRTGALPPASPEAPRNANNELRLAEFVKAFFAAQHAQHAESQRFQLILAGEHAHRGDKGHAL